MRRENRVILAIILLLVGLITAALFRPPAQSEPEEGTEIAAKTPSYDETTPYIKPMPVSIRPLTREMKEKLEVTQKRMLPHSATTRLENEKVTRPVSRTITGSDLVPALPDRFPTPQKPLRPNSIKRIHTIVDGDTLRSLASRYYDDEKSWLDIYEANRGVLDDPMSLPIGVKLTIPPQTADLGPQHASQSPVPSTPTQRQAARVTSRSASYSTPTSEQNPPASPVVRKVAKPIEKTLENLPSEPMVPLKP